MEIGSVGIVGAGAMGSGIAQACATNGIDVVLVDVSDQAVRQGIATMTGSLDRLVKKAKITEANRDAALARVHGGTDYAALNSTQLVIEAATESEPLKIRILQQLDGQLPTGTIIATNTSSLSITKLASITHRGGQFIGMHFFNPVPMMSLVEIIRGLQTSDATHAAVLSLARALGKTAITVKNAPGFVVNRILVPMINEAFFVLAEGLASPKDIDAGLVLGCNHPVGPLALADMVGLDVCLAVTDVYHKEFGDPKYRAAPLLREMVAAGWLGRKSGRGVYVYDRRG